MHKHTDIPHIYSPNLNAKCGWTLAHRAKEKSEMGWPGTKTLRPFRLCAEWARDPDLNCLVQVNGHHLLHTVFDHLRSEEICLALLVHCDLAVVFQQDGADGLSGVGHIDRPIVAHHFTEVRECPTVVQVEMAGGM